MKRGDSSRGAALGLLSLLFGALAVARTGLPRRAFEARTSLPATLGAAREERIDPWLLFAVARVESSFRPEAVSKRGARGIVQLMPKTAREMAGTNSALDLSDPAVNLRLGARYLRILLDRFGDTRHALAAYNGGPSAVAEHLSETSDTALAEFPKGETRRYVDRVMVTYDRARRWVPFVLSALRRLEAAGGSAAAS